MASSRGIALDEIVAHLRDLEDPRSGIDRRHPLVAVIVIAVPGVLAEASGPPAIAERAAIEEAALVAAPGPPAGAPGKDVFRRALRALQPAAFRKRFAGWLESLRAAAAEASGVERPVPAGDGKALRRGHDRKNGRGALHSVSIRAGEYGLALGQVAGAEESDEIAAIPESLRPVDIKGASIAIDARGARKAIAEEVIGGKADQVPALKGDQEALHQAVIDHIDERLEGDDVGTAERVVRERGHGRGEERTYPQLPVPGDLPGESQWKDLKPIGAVTSRCLRDGQGTVEVRYDISSLAVEVKRFARAVRSHRGIENMCHWTLDVTCREDESRIRERLLREDFARLNRPTLSLLKPHPGKGSIARKRRACGWSDKSLMEVLTGIVR